MKWANILKIELLKYRRSRTFWLITSFCFALIALLFYQMIFSYMTQVKLAQMSSGHIFGITREVIKPFWGWVLLLMSLLTPLFTLQTIGLEYTQKTFNLWALHHICAKSLWLGKWLSLVFLETSLLLLFLILPLSTAIVTSPDWGLMLSGFITNWLVMLLVVTLSCMISFLVPYPAFAFILSYVTLFFICLLPWLNPFAVLKNASLELSPLTHAHGLMNGRLYVQDILYFIISIWVLMVFSFYLVQQRLLKIL